MEAAETSLFPGYRLDRYELLCPIASGGMASVWLARLRGKRGFEKLFAIKTIKTELISDPNYQQMFLDEARIASRIVHPNVAQILELGEENDILFLVMEWVDGDSLAKIHRLILKAGQTMPVPIALRIVSDICAGLHAAHQLKDQNGELLGVVHRDVSPQNVLLSSEGNAKVIDFGLVKAKGRTSAETANGIVKGKIRYMAPEQVGKGSAGIDHRADVWACAMCLLELVTGQQPYHELDDLDVVKNLMTPGESPPIPDDIPPVVKSVLARALVREPDKRFPTCAQMKRALDQAIHELGEPVDPDDIATFVNTTLPELGAKRSRTIARAIEVADGPHGTSDKPSIPISAPSTIRNLDTTSQIGFAKTEVSARAPDPNFDDAVPLTRRVKTVAPEESEERVVTDTRSTTSTGGTSLRDQLSEKKKGPSVGYILAGIVVVAAAAFILFPRGSKPTTPANAEPQPSASVTEIPSSTVPVDTTQPPPPASGSAAVEMDLPATPASAAPSAAAVDAGRRLTWPSGGAAARPPSVEVDAGPSTPKFNPAWSILTHPPPGVLSENVAPPPPPAPEPKPE